MRAKLFDLNKAPRMAEAWANVLELLEDDQWHDWGAAVTCMTSHALDEPEPITYASAKRLLQLAKQWGVLDIEGAYSPGRHIDTRRVRLNRSNLNGSAWDWSEFKDARVVSVPAPVVEDDDTLHALHVRRVQDSLEW